MRTNAWRDGERTEHIKVLFVFLDLQNTISRFSYEYTHALSTMRLCEHNALICMSLATGLA